MSKHFALVSPSWVSSIQVYFMHSLKALARWRVRAAWVLRSRRWPIFTCLLACLPPSISSSASSLRLKNLPRAAIKLHHLEVGGDTIPTTCTSVVPLQETSTSTVPVRIIQLRVLSTRSKDERTRKGVYHFEEISKYQNSNQSHSVLSHPILSHHQHLRTCTVQTNERVLYS